MLFTDYEMIVNSIPFPYREARSLKILTETPIPLQNVQTIFETFLFELRIGCPQTNANINPRNKDAE